MNSEKATYISDLIFSQLASYHSVLLPDIGCLRCILINAAVDRKSNKLLPPRYVIEFYRDGNDKNIIAILAETPDITEEEAKTLYDEWITSIRVLNNEVVSYDIPKVGTLSVNGNGTALFVPAKELEPFTNPFGNDESEKITVPAKVVKQARKKIDKRKNTRNIIAALLIAAIGILSFVLVQVYTFRDNRIATSKAEKREITEQTKEKVTFIISDSDTDSVSQKREETTIIQPKEVVANNLYNVIVGTFADSSLAVKLYDELNRKEIKNAAIFRTENRISPHYVSTASFATLSEAEKYLSSMEDNDGFWIYKVKDTDIKTK